MLGYYAQRCAVNCDQKVVLNIVSLFFDSREVYATFRPAMISLPSGVHVSVNGCSPTFTSPTLAFDRMSQNLTMPSVPQLASSFSLIGWKETRSSEVSAVAPGVRSSVEFFTFVFSGFHIRSVRSAAPVAINVPEAFQDIVRIKCEDETAPGRRLSW